MGATGHGGKGARAHLSVECNGLDATTICSLWRRFQDPSIVDGLDGASVEGKNRLKCRHLF